MEKILILDFGSQYTQLIARRVRELNVYCEIHPFNHMPEIDADVKGVILSGSPASVRDEDAPKPDLSQIKGKLPLLGVCYGAQYLAYAYGGEVEGAPSREYGRAMLSVVAPEDPLMHGLPSPTQVWMSHGDSITSVPANYEVIGSTEDVKYAAYHIGGEMTWGIQFHPEVFHSTDGPKLLSNFVMDICGCAGTWSPASFIDSTVAELKEKIGDDKVIMGLSGGVDSTVAAVLLHKAIGHNLHCIFVNNGLLRANEFEDVLASYQGMGLNVTGVDASERFYNDLKGVTEPEQKRKIIGRDFVEVFNAEAKKEENARWLGQGTIYPDVIESCSVKGPSATIKSHHNVGGLPKEMNLQVVEPLRLLFKDEVRCVGHALGLPASMVERQPFPGPGLGVRCLGAITRDRLAALRESDAILREEFAAAGLADKVWQFFTVVPDFRSTGVRDGKRAFDWPVIIRAVNTVDAMTATVEEVPWPVLKRITRRITSEVPGVNRVLYDLTPKPTGTIEFE